MRAPRSTASPWFKHRAGRHPASGEAERAKRPARLTSEVPSLERKQHVATSNRNPSDIELEISIKLSQAAAICDLVAAAGQHDSEELGKGTVYSAMHAAQQMIFEALDAVGEYGISVGRNLVQVK
jgi:hypothetical protein